MIISSQRYIDDRIVAEKLESNDFTITVSPKFEIDGTEYQVLMDGNHSLAAAKLAGVEPEIIVATAQTSDRICLLESGLIDDFMQAEWIDSDWYDVDTGDTVWA